ncbi:putative quinol monooxygenase [Amycolatopsis thermoflava]|uniref:Quinol monooxygenase YgiN n=1 Tax=Amycolatopsis thermoflava TaxID=84480 RepID=A0A3N2GPV6_9PSEU|nr:putative quinol monooxygenase [Amycolatopsis thermoflava]PXY23406.1 hypothetical protein BAY59_27410 [Prauserella coralliicola]ROS38430.1 quinol monooxygenase YgiN [Amycolatopsis thermoflava]
MAERWIQVATIVAKEGDEGEVGRLLAECVPPSRAEEGVLLYELVRSKRNPRQFLVYEVYRDRGARDAHRDSEHVQRLIVGDVLVRAESVDIAPYVAMQEVS